MTLLAAAAVIAILLVIFGLALARSGRRKYRHDNQVGGVDTGAPESWAGAHSPEARLHRRIRDAVAALDVGGDPDLTFLQAKEALQREAVALDERLVTVAKLQGRVKERPLADVAAAVEALEDATGTVVAAQAQVQHPGGGVDEALALVHERVTAITSARAELESPPPRDDRPQPSP